MEKDEQNQFAQNNKEFISNTKLKNPIENGAMALLKGREMAYNAFEIGIFISLACSLCHYADTTCNEYDINEFRKQQDL